MTSLWWPSWTELNPKVNQLYNYFLKGINRHRNTKLSSLPLAVRGQPSKHLWWLTTTPVREQSFSVILMKPVVRWDTGRQPLLTESLQPQSDDGGRSTRALELVLTGSVSDLIPAPRSLHRTTAVCDGNTTAQFTHQNALIRRHHTEKIHLFLAWV